MVPVFHGEELVMLISALASSVPSLLINLATYVLSAMAFYTIASRRGLKKPWLAWIPVVNVWILGSLSDQYQYLVKGQNKSKRKILLLLNILSVVFSVTIAVLAGVMVAAAIVASGENQSLSNIMGPAMAMLGMCLPVLGVSLAVAVIRYMAMYDIYRSLDPDNAVLFLVLSVLFHITEPFFLFFNRNKDAGMPPRKRREPDYVPEEDYVCVDETDGKNYL